MDLALVTGGLAFVGLSSYVVRRLRGCRVNCWFCNTDQVVPWSSKNAFVCTGCDQYNGFNEDGDYNKQILGQHFASSRTQKMRFCNSGLLSDRPDVVPSRFENGLCEECNQKQEIIVERLSQFEPKNESHWQAEVDDYKNRLNKIYALCEPCLMASQRKLRRDKSLYGYLMHLTSFGRKLASTIVNGNNSSPNKKTKKSRKCFFAGGRVTEINHFVVFIIATLLALAEVNFLQQISNGMPSIDGFLSSFLGNATAPLLGFVHDSFYGAIILLFASNSIAMLSNKCRISFPDLLVFVLSLLLFTIAHDVFPKSFQKDLVLFRCGFSSLLFCLSTAVWILPRKLKHKKRPNTIASAFSIASTPMSQCSTIRSARISMNGSMLINSPMQDRFNKASNRSPSQISFGVESIHTTSTLEKSATGLFDFKHQQEKNKENRSPASHIFSSSSRTPSASSLVSSLNQWRDTRETTPISPQNEHNRMEWEHSDVGRTPSHPVLRQRQSSPPRIGEIKRKSRENTPSRDLGGLLGGLKLGKGDSSSPHRGPFSSLSFHPGVRNAYSVASEKSFQTAYQNKSHYTGFTSVSQRSPNPLAMPPSLRSRFTNDSASVSTRLTDPHPQYQPQPTQKLLVALVIQEPLASLLHERITRNSSESINLPCGKPNKMTGVEQSSAIPQHQRPAESEQTKKSRKCFFAGGRVTEINHFVVFIIATLLALAEVNFLQQISNGMPSIDGVLSSFLGNATAPLLGFVHDSFYGAIILLFASNSIAMLSNKCRISFPDLLVFGLSLMLFIIAHDVFPKSFQKDLVLFRCGFSSLLFCLSTAVWILPRKLKHKKRPNTIASAFSIASTPMSQCSTSPISPQNEHNQMDWEHSYVGRTPSHLIRRQGQSSPPRLGEFSRQNEHNQMEWEHGDVGRTPSHLVRRQQQSSPPRIGGIERKSRESISSRDFGGLKLGKGDSSSPHHGSFSSLYFHPGVRNANSVASEKSFQTTYQSKSHYTGFTPVSQRSPNPLAMPPSLRSRFTNDSASVSTRLTDPHPQYQPQPTQKLLVGLVVLCFLSNILPIYYLWVKPWI
ncbi:unnamed protein product, partial [Mesorhabditis belari]|uniref:Ima1 N-terminal domain-containing protein n=1 Tax=Mesorhabditis belari TaxID=2138241 RepID=A0AAF3FJP4_9BILA